MLKRQLLKYTLKRLCEKLLHEWIYNSNTIEGIALTTRQKIIANYTAF